MSETKLNGRTLKLTARETLEFFPVEHNSPVKDNEVRAWGLRSAISHGTEMNLYMGTSPFDQKIFDMEKRLFVSGEGSAAPAALGYEWIGQVIETGKKVTRFKSGDIVHLPLPHAECHTFGEDDFLEFGVDGPVPPDVDETDLLFLNTAGIVLQAIHDARINLGDRILITGMGVLGLMAVQMAGLSGAAAVYAADPDKARRQLALRSGAARVFDPLNEDAGAIIKNDCPGADTAIEFSGQYPALQQAVRALRMGGTVVAAGFYQGESFGISLGEEWLHNRITMRASNQGWKNMHRESPRWCRARLRHAALELMRERKLSLTPYLTKIYDFDQAPAVYEKLRTDKSLLKTAFKYQRPQKL